MFELGLLKIFILKVNVLSELIYSSVFSTDSVHLGQQKLHYIVFLFFRLQEQSTNFWQTKIPSWRKGRLWKSYRGIWVRYLRCVSPNICCFAIDIKDCWYNNSPSLLYFFKIIIIIIIIIYMDEFTIPVTKTWDLFNLRVKFSFFLLVFRYLIS